MKFLVILVLVFYFFWGSECSKILLVAPTPTVSHHNLIRPFVMGLTDRGHDVTLVSPFREKYPPTKGTYREVVLEGFLEAINDVPINFFEWETMNPILYQLVTYNFIGLSLTKTTFNHTNFQKLLKSGEKFDVVILEQMVNDGMKGLAYHFDAPLIILSTIGANDWINSIVGNPSPYSYIPDMMLNYGSDMTFWQRLYNSIFRLIFEIYRNVFFFPAQNKIMKEYLPEVPDLSIVNYNVSLVLLNEHESMNQPVPHVPNMISIGGYHLNPPKKLPNDLQVFLEKAKDGVIYFSMGSALKPSKMDAEIKEKIIKSLGKVKQKVLWKWDDDHIENQPKNFKIAKWFPQQDLLAHPNVKLFVTHGGLLSTTETIYHGVPILAFPVFGDQKANARLAENAGFGKVLLLSQITETKLDNVLNELLHNPRYRETAKTRSALMHDRPMKPLDLAIYWIEFVMRHRGASHLRVAAVDIPWYKYFLLDVLAFSLFSLLVVSIVLKYIFQKLCCSSKKKKIKIN